MIDDSKFIYISFVSDTLGHVLTRCLSFSKDVFWPFEPFQGVALRCSGPLRADHQAPHSFAMPADKV